VAATLALALLPAAAAASAAPIIYVHGVSESACNRANLGDLRQRIGEDLAGAFQTAATPTACKDEQPERNPLNFLYVHDQAGSNDADTARGGPNAGTSDSGVGANAEGLHRYIDALWLHAHRKVSLVAFSMGGLIVRTYLERYSTEADERVAAVAFVDSALSGSVAAVAARDAGSPFPKLCLGFLTNAGLCYILMPALRDKLNLHRPNAIALRDLSPGSAVIRDNAASTLPRGPHYLTVYGDMQLHEHGLGIGRFRLPDTNIPVGDIAIPAGDPDPHHVPPFGGARLQLGPGYQAREQALPYTCPFSSPAAAALADLAIHGGPVGAGTAGALAYESPTVRCIMRSPVTHWAVDAGPGNVRAATGQSVTDLVIAFLRETCQREPLGACGASSDAVRQAPSECGHVRFLLTSAQLDVRISRGALSCSEARQVIAHANFYQDGGSPGGWTCYHVPLTSRDRHFGGCRRGPAEVDAYIVSAGLTRGASVTPMARCATVRGYDWVRVQGISCASAAPVLWHARQGSATLDWKCRSVGVGPGGGFPEIETCRRGSQIAKGSVFDGPA